MLLLSSCDDYLWFPVQSLSPFCSEKTRVSLPGIEGKWEPELPEGTNVQDRNLTPWLFSKDEIESYDTGNRFFSLGACYFKINDVLFANFTLGPKTPDINNNHILFGITPIHTLWKVQMTDETLTLVPLKYDWFEKMIQENKLERLPYHLDKNVILIIFTASTEQWDDFLKEHANDEEIFDIKHKFVFKRKK